LKTNAAIETLHFDVVSRNSAIEKNQVASLNKLSSQASTLESYIQDIIQADLSPIKEAAASYFQQLQNFTEMVATSNTEIERHVAVNTEHLERQADAISKLTPFLGGLNDPLLILIGLCVLSMAPAMTKYFVAIVLTTMLIRPSGMVSLVGQGAIYGLVYSIPTTTYIKIAVVIAMIGLTLGAIQLSSRLHRRRQQRSQGNVLLIAEPKVSTAREVGEQTAVVGK
jgi:hypothetical protein